VYIGATISWQYAINGGLGMDLNDLIGENVNMFFKVDGPVADVFLKLISSRQRTLLGYLESLQWRSQSCLPLCSSSV
jgi:hypothetical protein